MVRLHYKQILRHIGGICLIVETCRKYTATRKNHEAGICRWYAANSHSLEDPYSDASGASVARDMPAVCRRRKLPSQLTNDDVTLSLNCGISAAHRAYAGYTAPERTAKLVIVKNLTQLMTLYRQYTADCPCLMNWYADDMQRHASGVIPSVVCRRYTAIAQGEDSRYLCKG